MVSSWLVLVCLASLLHGATANSYHGNRTKIGWPRNNVNVLHPAPDSHQNNGSATRPVIGLPASDVEVLHPAPESHHNNGSATRPVIDLPASDVEVLHPAPDSSHMAQIVGGKDADHTKLPYQLQLAVDGNQMCGAAVIGTWWAVTAAHCLTDEEGRKVKEDGVTVRAGATYRNTGGRVHSIAKIIVHPRYDPHDVDYDIALLKVRQPFQFGAKVQKIALPPQGQKVLEGQMTVASGWGYLEDEGNELSDSLQYVMMPIVSQKKCKYTYAKYELTITERMMCAGVPRGRKDTCQGDSGGPLAVKGRLVGIVSWGIGCAVPGFPGIYTRVPKFRYWIKEHTGI